MSDADASTQVAFTLFTSAPRTGRWMPWIQKLIQPEAAVQSFATEPELKELTDQAVEVMSAERNLLDLELEAGEQVLLVGDIHGQLRDMQVNVLGLSIGGVAPQVVLPPTGGRDRKMLFLGDYVDRGPCGLEVMTLLLCLKVEFPQLVFLLRGNHEDFHTSRTYGFLAECRSKLSLAVWNMFNVAFCALPLAAVVRCSTGSIFCAHGGLSKELDVLQSLDFVDRSQYSVDVDGDFAIVDGLLWSDPQDRPGYTPNFRGCGCGFGPDVTEFFCNVNRIDFIVRAHQMVMEGYKWDHGNKLLTVFSAPNYCGINRNKGAVALYTAGKHNPVTVDVFPFESTASTDPVASPNTSGSPTTMMDYFKMATSADGAQL